MLKTCINKHTCIGCGICYCMCPNMFSSDTNGIAYVKLPAEKDGFAVIPDELIKNVIDAYDCCPAASIYLEE